MTDEFNIDYLLFEEKSHGSTTVKSQDMDQSKETTVHFLLTLPQEEQEKISLQTPNLVKKFVSEENALLNFGTSAVENVNRIVSRILQEQKNLKLPEIDDILRNANRDLKGFQTKYGDASKIDFDKREGLLSRLFNKGKSKLDDLYYDSKNVEQKMDVLAASIVKQEDVLTKNIISGELLLEENTKTIKPLIGVIAAIEASTVEATRQADELRIKLETLIPNTQEANETQQQLSRMTEVIDRLEQRHTEFVGRLYVAWTGQPQMRSMIKVSADLKSKLSLTRLNTIPTMKLTISQLGFLQQLNATSKVANSVDEANNNALQMLAETSKKVIPEVERTVQNPSITVESVVKLAESIVEQNNGLIEAIEQGRQKRREVEATIVQSATMITDSTKLRDMRIVEGITKQARELESK